MTRIIFLDGLPRSGTSFTARLIGSFPGIFLINDGIRIAREILYDIGHINNITRKYPLGMFDKVDIDLNDSIRNPKQFISRLKSEMEDFEKDVQNDLPDGLVRSLNQYLDEVLQEESISYKALFEGFFEVMSNSTGATVVGTKTTHQGPYIGAYLKAFPCAKWISIIRDARGNYSSYKVSHKAALYEFCKRRWYNHVESTLRHLSDKRYKDRVMLLKYEELMLDSVKSIHRIKDFIGVDFDVNSHLGNLVFKRADGRLWNQNSSYDNNDNPVKKDGWEVSDRQLYSYFDPRPVSRWKKVLDRSQIDAVGYLCSNGIKRLGYEVPNKRSLSRVKMWGVITGSFFKAQWHIIRPYLAKTKHVLIKR